LKIDASVEAILLLLSAATKFADLDFFILFRILAP
jgi:hypothetical protein